MSEIFKEIYINIRWRGLKRDDWNNVLRKPFHYKQLQTLQDLLNHHVVVTNFMLMVII